jgi:hypothetical protein
MATLINADTSDGLKLTSDTSGEIEFQSAGVTKVTMDTSGNVGIGTASPTTTLDVETTVRSKANAASNDSTVGKVSFYNTNAAASANPERAYIEAGRQNSAWGAYLKFATSDATSAASEAMRIDSSGNTILGSNTSTTVYNKLNIYGPATTLNGIFMEKQSQVVVQMGFKADAGTDFFIGTGSYTLGTYGVYLANTGTSWISVSDERQKDIIEPIENALTKVNTLRAVIGKYKHDEEGVRRSFLIAQDVQAVFPEAVEVQKNEEALLGLSYTDTIPLLVAAIKEQQAIIETLTTRIEALEAK